MQQNSWYVFLSTCDIVMILFKEQAKPAYWIVRMPALNDVFTTMIP